MIKTTKTIINNSSVVVEYNYDSTYEEFYPTAVIYKDVDVLPVLSDSQFEELKELVNEKGDVYEDI